MFREHRFQGGTGIPLFTQGKEALASAAWPRTESPALRTKARTTENLLMNPFSNLDLSSIDLSSVKKSRQFFPGLRLQAFPRRKSGAARVC